MTVPEAPGAFDGLDDAMPERWVDPAQLLDSIKAFIRKYVVLTNQQAIAVALWVAHTHAFEAAECTPYLHAGSAEKRCGKTRLLEVLELLVAAPWFTGRTSAAVLPRKIDRDRPTLLLDESDAAFGGERDYAEALRGILNAGYRRGGRTTLCVAAGKNFEARDFATFCPKAIAGIGKLPDTIADRSIRIEMRRRKSDERVHRFRHHDANAEAEPIRVGLLAWAPLAMTSLEGERPAVPPTLGDRAADVWEPLLAIADAAGDMWPSDARDAATVLSGDGAAEDDSLGVRLLLDVRDVFDELNVDELASTVLAARLAAIESSPWGPFHGQPFDARRLAKLLGPFKIKPAQLWIDGKNQRGYQRASFDDAWSRYAGDSGCANARSARTRIDKGFAADFATARTETPSGHEIDREALQDGRPSGPSTHDPRERGADTIDAALDEARI